MINTIHNYRKQGYKVRVLHGRLIGSTGEIQAKGGTTVIELTTPDGRITVKGTAKCSNQENYNRQVGNQIALGRALKSLEIQD